MEAVLDNLLAVLSPLVAVVQHIHVAPCLEAEPRFPHLPPHLHPSSFLPRCCRRRALPPIAGTWAVACGGGGTSDLAGGFRRRRAGARLAGIERPGAGGGSLLAGGGDGGAERDAGKKQRVQEAAVVVVVRREHQAMIIRSLLLDKRHLQKHVLLVRQRGKKGMRMGAWRRSNRVEASRKAGLQQLAAAPLHARI